MAKHSTVATSAVRPNEPARQVIASFDNYADAERDLHSISGLWPKYYDVVADVYVADRALQILTSDNRRE